MKTLKILAVILFMMISIQNIFSYVVFVRTPCDNANYPTRFFYPTSSVNVNYRIDTNYILDTRFALCQIYVIQNGVQVLMYQEVVETENWFSTPVNPMAFPNLGYNEPIEVKVIATSLQVPHLQYSKSGNFLIYKDGFSIRYGSITYESSQQLTNNVTTPMFSNGNCSSFPSASYFLSKYKIFYNLAGDFTDSIPEVVPGLCYGLSGAVPNNQESWGYKFNQTPTQAQFMNFVFDGYNILSQYVGWIPCNIQNARIVYRYKKKPVITRVNQYPTILTPRYNIGLFYCDLLQYEDSIGYIWTNANNIHNHQFNCVGPNCQYYLINTNLADDLEKNIDDRTEYLTVTARACNSLGCSDSVKKRVLFGDDPHGCPNFTVIHGRDTLIENPLLIESPDKPDTDITDNYMSTCPFFKYSDSIKFSIFETADGETIIDKLEMYQVKVPRGKEVVITEEGNAIDYTAGSFKNTAILNYKDDVTDIVNSNDNEILNFKSGDKLEVLIPSGGNKNYIVLRMGNPVIKRNDAVEITTSAGELFKFKVRDGMSNICLKLEKPGSDRMIMEALQDCYLDCIYLVKNDNENQITKLKLIDACNKKESIIKHISYKDNTYANITKEMGLDFVFQNEIDTAMSSYYFISLTGSYKPGSNDKIQIAEESHEKFEFKLNDNQPNPFNPVTKIKFEVPETGLVRLSVYDVSGREIKTLVNEIKDAGNYESVFDGSEFASGVYFYRLYTPRNSAAKRMILIK